jgi:fructokinase
MTVSTQSDPPAPIVAAIDAGGTTFKCALIQEGQGIIAGIRVPTTQPTETLQGCAQFFKDQAALGRKPSVMGIASFGPIDVDPQSSNYGMILDGPKLGWAATNLKTYFEQELSLKVKVDTDVNGALLAEMRWGAAKGANSAAYVTVGTGIGGGLFANGELIGKPFHPEFGHIRLRRHEADKDFPGVCSYHGDCLEGLASATAITKRFGNPVDLPNGHIGWDIEAYYLAQACNTLSLMLRPDKIVLGGGLLLAPHLIGSVRKQYAGLMNNYLSQSCAEIETLIVTPGLGDDAGLFGGACLAYDLL